jgi:uncharacterized protein YhhL (DUF1145 family)
MMRGWVWLLRVCALWTFWVWAVLVRNMAIDHVHSIGFRVVHLVLAVISMAFAVALLVLASRLDRRRRPSLPGAPVSQPPR